MMDVRLLRKLGDVVLGHGTTLPFGTYFAVLTLIVKGGILGYSSLPTELRVVLLQDDGRGLGLRVDRASGKQEDAREGRHHDEHDGGERELLGGVLGAAGVLGLGQVHEESLHRMTPLPLSVDVEDPWERSTTRWARGCR